MAAGGGSTGRAGVTKPAGTESFVVPAALAGERLDRALALLTGHSRADIGRAIAAGAVSIASAPANQRSRHLKEGEVITVALAGLAPPGGEVAAGGGGEADFEVVYADEDVIVVDKPAGLVTHAGAGVHGATLAGGLLGLFPELADLPAQGFGSAERPGIVHRLDKDTSGLLVVARSPSGYESLTAQMAARTAKRTYRALCVGRVATSKGIVDAPIGRSGRDPTKMAVAVAGRMARTRYSVLRRFSEPLAASELELGLETGRTHQIRVHLAAIGHPVLGDTRYGGVRRSSGVGRLMLHATRLGFFAPGGEFLEFAAAPPTDYAAALARFS